jgi:ubiquinone/menaquinone biosynthesis C-methylase UbiE
MAYTWVDMAIARMRFRAAYPFIKPGARVCDLGCRLQAAFLNYAANRIATGVGLDDQVEEGQRGRWKLLRADLQSPLPLEDARFDHVVMLAVLEHLREPEKVLREAFRVITPAGR